MFRHVLLFHLLLLLLSAGCARPPESQRTTDNISRRQVLFDAGTTIQDAWQHMPLKGATAYSLVAMDDRVAIQAEGRNSASALIRRIELDPVACPHLEWTWRVETLQPSADLRMKAKEDVGAAIFLMFGDPGFLFDPKPVPTLRYVWTTPHAAREAVIDSPYLPGTVRSIVVRNRSMPSGEMVLERRDINADFKRAFGREPGDTVQAIALFTDNDQTGEPVRAYYGWARANCSDE